MKISPLIEAEELLKIYQNGDVVIFDVSNHKDAKNNYEKNHIEGSIFIDINMQLADIKEDVSKGGRHPLPDIQTFGTTLTKFGITKQKHVIIYDDQNGANAAARFWWMLKAVGHEKVQVVNGGFNKAKQYLPSTSKIEFIQSTTEPYIVNEWLLPTIEMVEVEKILQNPTSLVIDVRDKNRYAGITEPIDTIAGHIPGATNIPYTENLDENGLFLNKEILKNKYKTVFENIQSKDAVVHCGSGVTACHTLLALSYADFDIPKLYVGSWSEWSRNNKEIAVGKD